MQLAVRITGHCKLMATHPEASVHSFQKASSSMLVPKISWRKQWPCSCRTVACAGEMWCSRWLHGWWYASARSATSTTCQNS